MFGENQIKRSSLGRVGFIGELYDLRNDSLSSQSILKSSLPLNMIHRVDVGNFEFDYKFTEKISDRFELFNVEGEIQISILLGLIKLEGSGKFLSDDKKSEKTISCSLKCQIQTVDEKLFGSFEEILPHLDLSALENSNYTHVISEINWGATCLLNLEVTCSSDSDKKEVQGCLAVEFSKFKGISVSGFSKTGNSSLLSGNNIAIKIRSDVPMKNEWPSTVEGFYRFLEEVPTLLQEQNDGKGKPLNYFMIPLSVVRKLAKLECSVETVVQNIDESFLVSTVYFFEELSRIKQKLQDLLSEMKENEKYVNDKDMREVREHIVLLSKNESELKCNISQDWISVRSGEKNLRDLIRRMEKCKNQYLNLFFYEEFIESYFSLLRKLSTIKSYNSRGILYLGKGEKFSTVQCNFYGDIIVLIISSEMEEADPELCTKTRHFFLTVASEKRPNFVYVVVDFDYSKEKTFSNLKITTARCLHLKGTKIVSPDMYAEFVAESESNFARPKEESEVDFCTHKPGKRTELEIVCPLRCSPNPVVWNCSVCKQKLDYGFDGCYYCFCGKAPAENFQYRCNNSKHGTDFVDPPDLEFVKSCLSKLRPFKEMNILIIGQTGVGKSTWINSIVNYLTYDSLEEAKNNKVICTIPATLTMYDSDTLEEEVINVGRKDANEVTDAGESATQSCHTYKFLWEGMQVRLIDTPGIGDTRGINQDKTNMANIIHHIGFHEEINGVCILLKANDHRSNAVYLYCLTELLTYLHRNVAKNIVFCFTNARSTLYSPGQAALILRKVIQNIGVKADLSLGRHNMFTLDNEAFIFLCSLRHSESHLDEIVQNSFAKSWDISVRETKRLFNTIKSFEPHKLKETISLVAARNRILSLTKPIAEISKTVQINLAAFERKKKEIDEADQVLEELAKKLVFTEIHLKSEPLNYPRTVCTSSSCVEYLTYKDVDVNEIEYKTHCHERCYLQNVTPQTVNNHHLKNCSAMSGGKCTNCGCGWENHMHVTYSQSRVVKQAVNKRVKKHFEEEETRKQEVEEFLEILKDKIEQYKGEQEMIMRISVKFGLFLRDNSISPYNDSVADYLKYLINEEEKKPEISPTENKMLSNLKELLERYEAQFEVIKRVLEQDDEGSDEELTVDAVFQLEEALYNLPLTGQSIRDSVTMNRSAEERINHYLETPIELMKRNTHKPTSLLSKTKQVTGKVFGKIAGLINPSGFI